MDRPLRLNEIAPGKKVRVLDVCGGGRHLRRRFVEMGIVRGAKIKVQRYAPLGDPMEIRLRCCALSLRLREAHHIFVEIDD